MLSRGGRSAADEQGKQENEPAEESVGLGESRFGFHGITSSASLSQTGDARNRVRRAPACTESVTPRLAECIDLMVSGSLP